jgi:hypothetical protein
MAKLSKAERMARTVALAAANEAAAAQATTPVEPAAVEATPETPATPAAEPVATPAEKKKRSAAWRKLPTASLQARIIFNEAAYNAKPKRGNSEKRIAVYVRGPQGMTVAEHRAAYEVRNFPKGFSALDLKWDLAHGFITVVEPVAEVVEPAPAQAAE